MRHFDISKPSNNSFARDLGPKGKKSLNLLQNAFNETLRKHAYSLHIRQDCHDPETVILQNRAIKGDPLITFDQTSAIYLDSILGLLLRLTGNPLDPSTFENHRYPDGKIHVHDGFRTFEFGMQATLFPLHTREATLIRAKKSALE